MKMLGRSYNRCTGVGIDLDRCLAELGKVLAAVFTILYRTSYLPMEVTNRSSFSKAGD
jgi:hypothetical protein